MCGTDGTASVKARAGTNGYRFTFSEGLRGIPRPVFAVAFSNKSQVGVNKSQVGVPCLALPPSAHCTRSFSREERAEGPQS